MARAIFFFNLGEYIAEVTLPTFLPSLKIDQKVVLGPFKGSQSNSRPICFLLTPLCFIFIKASLPIKLTSLSKFTKRSKPNSNGFVFISASAWYESIPPSILLIDDVWPGWRPCSFPAFIIFS